MFEVFSHAQQLALNHGQAPYLAAFVIGFLGGGHCIGMCGGIMAALSFSVPATEPARRWRILLSYNLGRIGSYTLIGVLAGALGYQLSAGHGLSVLRVIAGLLLIAMGLYLANWWRGLTYLEKAGGLLWRQLQPLGSRLMPVKSSGPALLLGMLWGWLPCGLVYTALAYGLSQASVAGAAGVMLAFGLGTLPAVLASGVFAERMKALMQHRGLRLLMAVLIMLFGVWTIVAAAQHSLHGGHGDHSQHPAEHNTHTEQHPATPAAGHGHHQGMATSTATDAADDSGVHASHHDHGRNIELKESQIEVNESQIEVNTSQVEVNTSQLHEHHFQEPEVKEESAPAHHGSGEAFAPPEDLHHHHH